MRKATDNPVPFAIRAWSNGQDACMYPDKRGYTGDHYEIIWIQKGSGQCWLNLKKYDITESMVCCIKPAQHYKLEGADFIQGYSIVFDESLLGINDLETEASFRATLIQLFECGQPVMVSPEAREDMQQAVEKMMAEYQHDYLFKAEILRRYLKVFLVYLSRHFGQVCYESLKTKAIGLVERFFVLLNNDASIKKFVFDYAHQLSVTPNYLNEMVKKNTGHPAGFHIRQRIVLEAKRMVSYSDVCTKEIAGSLGFSDMAHFSKFFKSNTGMNFSDFRKNKAVYYGIVKPGNIYANNINSDRRDNKNDNSVIAPD